MCHDCTVIASPWYIKTRLWADPAGIVCRADDSIRLERQSLNAKTSCDWTRKYGGKKSDLFSELWNSTVTHCIDMEGPEYLTAPTTRAAKIHGLWDTGATRKLRSSTLATCYMLVVLGRKIVSCRCSSAVPYAETRPAIKSAARSATATTTAHV